MRILIAGATGVIGRQAVRVLTAAGHDVVALARTPTRLSDVDVVAADALDATALTRAVRTAAPDVVVHMLTAIPDPLDPKHLARDMAQTNRLRTEGTANLIAAAGGARVISQGLAYAYDPAGAQVKDEDAPLWRDPPAEFAPVVAALRDMEEQVTATGGAFNIVDDEPTPIRTWLPELAAMIAAPQPRKVPAWIARFAVGSWGVAFMSGLAGASNVRARAELSWKPGYGSWRDGFATELT